MTETWLSTSWTETGLVVLSSVAIYAAVVAITRLVGLRTFSKMSSFDFAITIATGSIIASVAASSTSLANGALALAVLHVCQWSVARARRASDLGSNVVDNTPIALVVDGEFLDENLRVSRVTRADVVAKLRQQNVLRLADARYVILETTGDVSILTGDGPIDDALLEGLRGLDRTSSR